MHPRQAFNPTGAARLGDCADRGGHVRDQSEIHLHIRRRQATLVVTGGDTAQWLCDTLNTADIEVLGDLVPGIPWGQLRGGLLDGGRIITKAGGFGDADLLVCLFDQCRVGKIPGATKHMRWDGVNRVP